MNKSLHSHCKSCKTRKYKTKQIRTDIIETYVGVGILALLMGAGTLASLTFPGMCHQTNVAMASATAALAASAVDKKYGLRVSQAMLAWGT